VYSYVFETPIRDNKEFISTHLPHPYVLEPPFDNQSLYLPGNSFSANLILMGKAIDYLPYFIFVMEELGKNGIGKGRGRFLLKKVENLLHPTEKEGKVIFDARSKRISSDIATKTFLDISNEVSGIISPALTLDFLTPCRIIYRNRLTTPSDFNFLILMKNLLRRIYLLSYLFDSRLQIDYKALLEQAENVKIERNKLYWYDWERYSSRQDERMKLGGFKGEITFGGQITPLLPFIKIGEYIHLGKDTSFGLGKYIIVDNRGSI
jgi:CRISPR-associated endoribonuclease Cas6